jgi:hypothetical protein
VSPLRVLSIAAPVSPAIAIDVTVVNLVGTMHQ